MEIALSNVTHRFGELTALENVSLHAHEGEIVAIIGPSGCGKSTLLGIAGGILQPTAGEVVLRGVPAPDTLNEITFIFQDFSLLPWLNVRDNVAFVLKHHSLGRAELERRVANALERTGLTDFAHALPNFSPKWGSISSNTRGSTGVVA
jgi:NitT/TauT family transport system ATP-binding protein